MPRIFFEDKDCLIGKWLLAIGYIETLLGPSDEQAGVKSRP